MNDWTVCRFEALDVIVSADARPLDVGGFGHAGELMPAAFAGSLRTLILKRAGYTADQGVLLAPADEDLAKRAARIAGLPDANTGPDAVPPGLRLFAPLYSAVDGQLLMPAPRSALVGSGPRAPVGLRPGRGVADDQLEKCALLEMERGAPERSETLDTDARWWPLRRVAWWLAREAGGLGSDPNALASLTDGERDDPVDVQPGGLGPPAVFGHERRWGHSRTTLGAPEDGALFTRGVRRFRQQSRGRRLASAAYAGLFRGDEALLTPADGALVRLGGDGHLAQLSFAQGGTQLTAARSLLDAVTTCLEAGATGVQMYLATPALFHDGWRPRVLDGALRLRAAAVGRPQTIAGWNLRRKKPKPVRRAVPAGSVYFLDVVDRDAALAVVRQYHLNDSVSEIDPELGFGCALFGVWRTEAQG